MHIISSPEYTVAMFISGQVTASIDRRIDCAMEINKDCPTFANLFEVIKACWKLVYNRAGATDQVGMVLAGPIFWLKGGRTYSSLPALSMEHARFEMGVVASTCTAQACAYCTLYIVTSSWKMVECWSAIKDGLIKENSHSPSLYKE